MTTMPEPTTPAPLPEDAREAPNRPPRVSTPAETAAGPDDAVTTPAYLPDDAATSAPEPAESDDTGAPETTRPETPEPEPVPAAVVEALRRAERAEARAERIVAEAQQLRRRLRAAEAEREDAEAERNQALAAQAQAQRQRVDLVLADYLVDPADAWSLGGLDLAELLTADGAVDVVTTESAARRLIEAHPHWQRTDRPTPAMLNRSGVPWGYPPSALLAARGGATSGDAGPARPTSLGQAIREKVKAR